MTSNLRDFKSNLRDLNDFQFEIPNYLSKILSSCCPLWTSLVQFLGLTADLTCCNYIMTTRVLVGFHKLMAQQASRLAPMTEGMNLGYFREMDLKWLLFLWQNYILAFTGPPARLLSVWSIYGPSSVPNSLSVSRYLSSNFRPRGVITFSHLQVANPQVIYVVKNLVVLVDLQSFIGQPPTCKTITCKSLVSRQVGWTSSNIRVR